MTRAVEGQECGKRMNWRHELKFLCEERQLCMIENKLRHICEPDPNAGEAGSYRIKSLYFDTVDDRCCQEVRAGADFRRKYRIRSYNDNVEIMKLECKYSLHDRKAKEACEITGEQCAALLAGGISTDSADSGLLLRFLEERRIELLMPKAIVEYERTPYVFRGGNVRITFDRAIRTSRWTGCFLTRNIPYRSVLPENTHILEVKYDKELPGAVRELLTVGQELRRTSFSKYERCREFDIG